MKIGLFLQDQTNLETRKNEIYENFNKALELAKTNKLDLLVFPEFTITPYDDELDNLSIDENDPEEFVDVLKKITEISNCSIIIGKQDKEGVIYQYFINNNPIEDETDYSYYIKHTYTSNSCFEYEDYIEDLEEEYFPVINFKDLYIGQIICNDSILPIFSRMYGIQNVNLIINSTGQDVDYKKWSNYLKVRAIENNCYYLCTMSNVEENKEGYSIGYDNYGKKLNPLKTINFNNTRDKISIFEINNDQITNDYENYNNYEIDEYIEQQESENKIQDLYFNLDSINDIDKLRKIDDHLFLLDETNHENIIVAFIYEDDILYPEVTLNLFFNEKLKKYKNKKYIILNQWDNLDKEYYEKVLSNIIKVRATENYCTVILKSEDIIKCVQSTKHRNPQLIKKIKNQFGLDLSRMGGPDVTYSTRINGNNGYKFHEDWKKSYEQLVEKVCQETFSNEQFELVTEIKQVEENICYFVENLKKDNTQIIKLLTTFKHWYYFPEKEYFAPSKFIGYVYPEGDRFSYYLNNNNYGMTGTDTEPALQKLNYYRNISDEEIIDFSSKLRIFLNNFGKKLRSNYRIHIPK